MISTSDFRTGVTVEIEGDPWQIIDFQHVKPGKGSPFVRAKMKNLRSGNVREETFRAGEKMPRAHVETKEMQYLYASGDEHSFMDMNTYDQINLSTKQIDYELKFLRENMKVHIVEYKGEMLGVNLPNTVELEVTETEPGIRGDTATGGSKPAKLETGHVVNVPFFINVGDKLIIDTRTGHYVSRA